MCTPQYWLFYVAINLGVQIREGEQSIYFFKKKIKRGLNAKTVRLSLNHTYIGWGGGFLTATHNVIPS